MDTLEPSWKKSMRSSDLLDFLFTDGFFVPFPQRCFSSAEKTSLHASALKQNSSNADIHTNEDRVSFQAVSNPMHQALLPCRSQQVLRRKQWLGSHDSHSHAGHHALSVYLGALRKRLRSGSESCISCM